MRRPPSEPPELPGYSFERVLGAGGFSDVFLYQQRLPRRKVAVKVLLTEGLTAASRAAFVAEANLMAQLSAHPYIVTIYHAEVSQSDQPYIVMEYCSGPSLGERYKRETFAVADAIRTGVRLCSAIATAHQAGILHRDIKPANVLTNDYGWPALTDFGISSAIDDELPVHTGTLGSALEAEATGESQSVGMSVPWSPPEMFDDDPQPDVRSDVFSLAATIHTLLAGRTPFEVAGRSNGTLDLIGRIERGIVTPIGREDVPRSLVAVLQKGMATRREERFASALEFARALQRVELELGYQPTSIEIPNLDQVEVERDQSEDGADETRVRTVATIDAQGPASPAPGPDADETRARPVTVIAPPEQPVLPVAPGGGAVLDEGTVVRRPGEPVALDESTVVRSRPDAAPAVPASASTAPAAAPSAPVSPTAPAAWQQRTPAPLPTTAAPAPSPAAGEPAPSRRGLVIGIASAALLLLVVAGIVLAVVFGGDAVQDEAEPSSSPTGGGSAIVETSVPTPVAGAVTPGADGASVVFAFSIPDAEEGDALRWVRTDEPDAVQAAVDGTATVTTGGQRVCIDVSVIRAGRLSADPLRMCYPE